MNQPDVIFERDKKYQQIKQVLRKRLKDEWGPGQRLPPIKQLAGELGLGQNNTHRAIRELVAEGLLVSRPGHGTYVVENIGEYDLDESIAVKRDRPLSGKRVAIVHPWRNPDQFAVDAIDAAKKAFIQAGCRAAVEIRRVRRKLPGPDRYDGLLLINPEYVPLHVHPRQQMAIVDTAGFTPVVSLHRYDVVSFDSMHAGCIAGQVLRELGCERVSFLGRADPENLSEYDQTSLIRLHGLQLGLGRPIGSKDRLRCQHYMSIDGAHAAKAFLELKQRPDAVCAASDEIAVGFIHGLASHGVTCPDDVQVIGFDGQEFGATMSSGPLTTIQAPMEQMGKRAAEMLADRIVNPKQPVRRLALGGRLIAGQTTKPLPDGFAVNA